MSVIIDGSAGVTTNAGGSVNPSTTIDGINFSCRAFVNFNGQGTVAIRASGNVSSITDNGTGDYTVNFTTAMPDADYTITGTTGFTASATSAGFLSPNRIGVGGNDSPPTTSACRVNGVSDAGNATADSKYVSIAFFR